MNFIDLTHPIQPDMPVYPGDAEPEFLTIASIESDNFLDTQLTTSLHVGTHLDFPAHIIKEGKVLADYPPDRFIGRGILLDARGKSSIDAGLLRDIKLQPGDIVLVLTGRLEDFGEASYYERWPLLTEAFADLLIDAQVSMLGLDTPGPDATPEKHEEPYPIHRQLLQGDVLIAENLNHLDQLANVKAFEVIALPLPISVDGGGAPARVLARIEK